MSRARAVMLDRSTSEPSGLREKQFLQQKTSLQLHGSEDRSFSQAEFYNSFLESLDGKIPTRMDTKEWRELNDLTTHPVFGNFSGVAQERTYVVFTGMYTDSSMIAFFGLYVLVFSVSLTLEAVRVGSSFDVGLHSRTLRIASGMCMLGMCIGVLVERYRNADFFIDMKEHRRIFLARIFGSFWFFYFPTVHAGMIPMISLSPQVKFDTFVVWTFILLHLTALGVCAAFKLRFRYAVELVVIAALQSLFIVMNTPTVFNWTGASATQLHILIVVFNLAILRGFDHQARNRFVTSALEYEKSRRVMAMAKRLRAAQAFASASWKSDNTVMSLRRIRGDPVLDDEIAHKTVLDVAISTIAHSGEASATSVPEVWTSRGWSDPSINQSLMRAFDSPPSPTSSKVSASPQDMVLSSSPPGQNLPAHFRRISSLTETEGLLERDLLEPFMSDWDFGAPAGIWTHVKDSRLPMFATRPLVSTMMTALDCYGFFDSAVPPIDASHDVGPFLNKSTALRYFAAVESAYKPRDKVPYHNALHAVDVVQTVFAMTKLDVDALQGMPRLALFALLFGAAVHDVGHPGVNNSHLIACKTDLAIQYNDRSVLENFHVSHAFKLMAQCEDADLMKEMIERDKKNGTQNARVFRNLVIDMVLSTDLAHHFESQARFRARLASQVDFNDIGDTSLICSILLHAADVGNVAKVWTAYEPWIDLLFDEFFTQGDREKKMGIPVAPFMDRDVSVPERAQSAFITNIVLPLYQVMADFTPVSAAKAVNHMNKNLTILDRKAREKEASRRTSPAASLETILSQPYDSYASDDGSRKASFGNVPDDDEGTGDDEN